MVFVKLQFVALPCVFLYHISMLDPKHLLWLAETAELGSMSAAAQKLHVTQPTLSRAIQVIEGHVGGKVLERERHGVRPTEIGGRLVEMGRKIIETKAQAEDIVDLWQDGLERALHVGVGPMLATTVMGSFFARMVTQRPRYGLRIVSATVFRLIERLNNDELDVVLAPERVNHFQDDLVQYRLMRDELAIFAGRENSISGSRTAVPPEVLEAQTWISVGTFSGISGTNEEIFRILGMRNVPSRIAFTGDTVMVLEILRSTDAVCVLPRRLVELSTQMDDIIAIPTGNPLPTRNLAMWSRKTDRDRPDIINFREKIESYFRSIVGN